MRQKHACGGRCIFLGDGKPCCVGFIDGNRIEHVKFDVSVFGFTPRVGYLQREVVMPQPEGLTCSVEGLAVTPNIEPFPPREIERL